MYVLGVYIYICVCFLRSTCLFPAQHMYARAAGECFFFYMCVHGCIFVRAACILLVVCICVFHEYTYLCLNWTCVLELPM